MTIFVTRYFLPRGVECADTIDSDRALREEWNKNLKQSQRKSDSTSNKKVSFLESLEKDFKDFDQDGIPTKMKVRKW